MSQDAHKAVLSRLCSSVKDQHAKGLALLAEADAAPDMGTVKEKLAAALPLLSDTGTAMDAIVQTATVMATGEMPVKAAEKPAEADPVPAAGSGPSVPYTSAEAASVAPASSSDAPASTEVTADMADQSAEDTAAKRKR